MSIANTDFIKLLMEFEEKFNTTVPRRLLPTYITKDEIAEIIKRSLAENRNLFKDFIDSASEHPDRLY